MPRDPLLPHPAFPRPSPSTRYSHQQCESDTRHSSLPHGYGRTCTYLHLAVTVSAVTVVASLVIVLPAPWLTSPAASEQLSLATPPVETPLHRSVAFSPATADSHCSPPPSIHLHSVPAVSHERVCSRDKFLAVGVVSRQGQRTSPASGTDPKSRRLFPSAPRSTSGLRISATG